VLNFDEAKNGAGVDLFSRETLHFTPTPFTDCLPSAKIQIPKYSVIDAVNL
jgi:hypothetical protein